MHAVRAVFCFLSCLNYTDITRPFQDEYCCLMLTICLAIGREEVTYSQCPVKMVRCKPLSLLASCSSTMSRRNLIRFTFNIDVGYRYPVLHRTSCSCANIKLCNRTPKVHATVRVTPNHSLVSTSLRRWEIPWPRKAKELHALNVNIPIRGRTPHS
jgi:hypothetical protein